MVEGMPVDPEEPRDSVDDLSDIFSLRKAFFTLGGKVGILTVKVAPAHRW
jgi:hypothetical protein